MSDRSRRDSWSVRGMEEGFTLIELLVVVIIIGILAAIAIPVFLGVQTTSKDAGVKSDLGSAKQAVVAYFVDKGNSASAPTFDSNSSTGLVKYGYGYSAASTTSVAFKSGITPSQTSFCINATGVSGAKFYTDQDSGIIKGTCP